MPRGARTVACALHSSPPIALSTASTTAPDGDQRARRPPARARASGPGPGPARAARTASRAAPVPAPGSSGARRSSAARGAGELDGEDAREVRDRRAQLARGAPAHRDVVLLHRAGGQRVDAGRRGEPAVLGHHRRLRVLGDHQSRVRRPASSVEERRQARASARRRAAGRCGARRSRRPRRRRSRGSRRRTPTRRAVEVAARLDPAVGQHHRVVDRGAQLGGRHAARRGSSVSRAAPFTCGRAAQRVGVLHARVVVAVAGDDRRAGEQLRRFAALSGLARAAGAARPGRSANARSVPSSASTDIAAVTSATLQEAREVVQREHQHPEDPVGAVDQRQPLLGA